jgi:hypothetical protein
MTCWPLQSGHHFWGFNSELDTNESASIVSIRLFAHIYDPLDRK